MPVKLSLMNEKQTKADLPKNAVRPTKKQSDLLSFIESFIAEHGYSPSYREIMAGCNYTSVATVALHVNSLIKRGHLVKRGRSARSLELASPNPAAGDPNSEESNGEDWLLGKIEALFKEAEREPAEELLSRLDVLVAALGILELEAAELEYGEKLRILRKTE